MPYDKLTRRAAISALAFCLIAVGHPSSLAASKQESRLARAESKAFLERNLERKGVVATRSGLQYEVIRKGDSDRVPRSKDIIEIHYHGTLIDGTVFDSSQMRGEPIDIRLWEVIPGWAEGIKLMSPGDKYKFYIPSNLAYGSKGNGAIPGHAALIVEIELLRLKEKPRKRKE